MLIGYIEHVQGMLIVEGIEGTGQLLGYIEHYFEYIWDISAIHRLYIVYVSVAARIVTGCI